LMSNIENRTCIICGETKSADSFRQNKLGHPITRKCKRCISKTVWKNYYRAKPAKIMIQSAKFRARRDNVPFSIKESDIVIPDVCPVLGIKLVAGDRHNHDYAPTLDKIIPELGYVAGNIIVISHRANLIKSNATVEELEKIAHFYKETRERAWQSAVS